MNGISKNNQEGKVKMEMSLIRQKMVKTQELSFLQAIQAKNIILPAQIIEIDDPRKKVYICRMVEFGLTVALYINM